MLRAAGAGVALPFLDCMASHGGRAARAAESATPPKRLMVVHLESGLMPQFFFPKRGDGGDSSPYLDLLADHRGHFTSFAGVSHPNLGNGHEATNSFLTGAPDLQRRLSATPSRSTNLPPIGSDTKPAFHRSSSACRTAAH